MLDPSFYPHAPADVKMIQTHISYIFIAEDLVFKIKKEVDFGFLDFTTLEKRKYFCNEELRLNKRLAPDTYLSVETLSEASDGSLMWGDNGRIIEYAVKMKRLPEERILSRILHTGKIDERIMDAIARRVFTFHEHAETGGEIDRLGSIETVKKNHIENFVQTEPFIDITLTEDQFSFIKQYALSFLSENEDLFKKRVAMHRIRDCHGDLHLQHICLEDGIIIFDCIEFNKRFRYLDVAAEIAFLSMDLDFNGYCKLGDAFIKSYLKYSRDEDIKKLINFYRCYFAYVRGKVTGFVVNDQSVGQKEQQTAALTASKYFELSFRYAAAFEKPVLIITAGLMGTGKSILAQGLAKILKAEIIRSDVVRKELRQMPPLERHFEQFGEGIYSEDMSRRTYDKALASAEIHLKEGRNVIIDASFKKKQERQNASALAEKLAAHFFILECVCPEKIIKDRLEARVKNGADPSDGRWEIFQKQKNDFEPVKEEICGEYHIIVNTSRNPTACIYDAIRTMKKAG
jgi:aminoglycoside phosphotransferase family enzyme/predicted kinase